MGGTVSKKMVQVSDNVKLLVDNKIKDKKVMVFSKTYCPYCVKAKKALAKYHIDPNQYEVIELENREDCAEIQQYLSELTGSSTVPRVFINGKFIGGGDDTVRLDNSGELVKLLQECGVLQQN